MSEGQGVFGLSGFYGRPRLISNSDKQEQIAGGGFIIGDRTYCEECHPWFKIADTTFSFDLSNDLRSKPNYTFARLGATHTKWLGEYAYTGLFGGEKIEMEKQKKDGDDWLWRMSTILGIAGRIPIYTTKEKRGLDLTINIGVDVLGLNGNGTVDGFCGLEGGLNILYLW